MEERLINYHKNNKTEKLIYSILINMGEDRKITDEKYSKYFKENDSILGVKQIIKNNNFIINGFPIPGTKEIFSKKYPEGYLINKKKMVIFFRRKISCKSIQKRF